MRFPGLVSFSLGAMLGAPLAGAQVPSPSEQIAAALLPLPEVLRAQAGVRGYAPTRELITLRASTNGMICTADRPGDDQFDVRCYDSEFLKVIDRYRELVRGGLDSAAADERLAAELKSGQLKLPDHPTAGYRMLGPIRAYDTRTNTTTAEIDKWQSVHFPYRTAQELGLPVEREASMPFVMASGTWWSHVMIVHTPK